MQILKTNLILVSRVFPRFHQVACFWFLIGSWWCWPFFFLTGGFDYFGYVGRQSLITVLFHSMLYAPESFSKKCETIPQFSMIISPSLKPVDQVLSKLSLKKTVCFATVNGWFWAKILLNKSSEKSQGLWLPPLCPTSSRGPQYEWSFRFFSIRLGLHRPYLTWSHWWC